MNSRNRRGSKTGRQRGVVLIFALVALVIMLIGAVAMTRSMNSTQFAVGNIGFKRDLANQSERALEIALDAARAGGGGMLADPIKRNTNQKSVNYSASLLATNERGIPRALLVDGDFDAIGNSSNDLTIASQGVSIRYVIDRLAQGAGACTPANCVQLNQVLMGGSASEWISSQSTSGLTKGANPSAVPQQPVFRITVRVTGPRKTLAFYQATFTTN